MSGKSGNDSSITQKRSVHMWFFLSQRSQNSRSRIITFGREEKKLEKWMSIFTSSRHTILAVQDLQGSWQVLLPPCLEIYSTCMVLAPKSQYFYSALFVHLKISWGKLKTCLLSAVQVTQESINVFVSILVTKSHGLGCTPRLFSHELC